MNNYSHQDRDVYHLKSTISSFVLPLLKRFREITDSIPMGMSLEEWHGILDRMIFAHSHIVDNSWEDDLYTECDLDKDFRLEPFGKDMVKIIPLNKETRAARRQLFSKRVKEVEDEITEGLNLFAKYYRDLWR